ncbi:MAG: PQQ-binding-like beta-propeller repeat protein [Planctomycetota bacterium]|nr:PQQ-binding-like beta-propeller repeat protein [Planctomycetota bacterium]
MRPLLALACLTSALQLAAAPVDAQEWTRFRGPNGTGVSEATTIPAKWTAADYNWKVELPGLGHSSPAIWGDKVFLLSADPDTATRYMLCYSTTDGSLVWRRDFNSEPHHLHTRSSYASSSPAVDAEHVYVGWSTPAETTFKAFNHDGSEAWSLNLGRWQSQHGFGASPILYEDLVILHNSQQANQLKEGEKPGDSFMMAFKRDTGKEVWRVPLVSMNVCYSVPFIYTPEGGADELVCISTGNGVFSLDPKTGEKNWALEGVFSMRTVGSPITAGGHIFGTTGSGKYSENYVAAIKPGKQPEVAYELKNSGTFKAPYVPSLIAKGDAVFCLYDQGFAACFDAPTGKVHWLKRTEAAFSGSPIRIRDRIFCLDEDGVVWVIAADEKEYRLLAKNDLGEPSRSTLAVSGGKLFVRTYSHLFCVGGKETVALAR